MTSRREGAPASVLIGDCVIEYQDARFLITKAPTDRTIDAFIRTLQRAGVRRVVRACAPCYATAPLEAQGIRVVDLPVEDGRAPSAALLDEWFELLRRWFREAPGCCVAVHCASGLGRGPLLVALALLELGMRCRDAVDLIRSQRRGAFNDYQLSFLQRYRPKSRFKLRNEKEIRR